MHQKQMAAKAPIRHKGTADTRFGLASLPQDVAFSLSFERYSARTDGKEKIAASIQELSRSNRYSTLLDLGAGDGRLTRLLAPSFNETFAIEVNPLFARELSKIPKVTPVIGTMEGFHPPASFDLALMSYSMSRIKEGDLPTFLGGLFKGLNPGGKICYATYQDGCAWDAFADTVYTALGIPRTGGAARHSSQLIDQGFLSHTIASLHTQIWADSIVDLYQTLGFFFIKKIGDYEKGIERFLPILEQYATSLPDGRVAIPVVELLNEISISR